VTDQGITVIAHPTGFSGSGCGMMGQNHPGQTSYGKKRVM
jgi:hypothetical protein